VRGFGVGKRQRMECVGPVNQIRRDVLGPLGSYPKARKPGVARVAAGSATETWEPSFFFF
jgi:hypothetical protein